MKKTLALVLAFALVFSTITVAFAEDAAIGADAKVCADLGMLVGDGTGVTAAYTATAPNRLQAAIMVLRLKGLEADAKAFTGTDNFADADKAAWAKPIMAYLKANPQLGWAGDGKNFDPTGAMTAQAYYKVMLETLGYKQNTATVVGDFTWEKVVEFAATKGLTKAAAVTNFTVNDLAVATVETLKANVKDTTKTLVASLVEANKVDKAKATAAGIYTEAAATAANLDAAMAAGNDKVEVTFDADVDKTFAENAANYKIVVKGSTTALEVKSATVINSTMVMLATAAQAGGTAYTLTVGSVSKNFSGDAKIAGAPEVDTVKCIDTNTVEIIFKKAMDRASVEDIANYTLNNSATVKKAELWIDQDSSRKTVKLTTEGVTKNKVYKLKIANVKSQDLVAIKSIEKPFAGIVDAKAPEVVGNVDVKTNTRIFIRLSNNDNNDHGINTEVAENAANYTIKSGTEELKIVSVVAKNNVTTNDTYAYNDTVEINTEAMTAGKSYTVSISNIADDSSSKNAIAKTITKTFIAKSVDKTAPSVGRAVLFGDSIVEVDFTDASRLDYATATDIANYTFDKDITVKSATVIRKSKPDTTLGKTVQLVISPMEKNKTYKLSVVNVADEFGNALKSTSRNVYCNGEDITPPYVKSVEWIDMEWVGVYFDNRVDLDSAQDTANYVVGDLGAPKEAVLYGGVDLGYNYVELRTAPQEKNTEYKITINGVKDKTGNASTAATGYFTSGVVGIDNERPTIVSASLLSKDELRVTFNEAVKVNGTSTITLAAAAGTLVSSGSVLDDGVTVVYRATAGDLTSGNTEFKISALTNVTDKSNNAYKVDANDMTAFYGLNATNDKALVDSYEQVDARTFRFIMSEPVKFVAAGLDKFTGSNSTGTVTFSGVAFNVSVDTDDDDTNEAESTVTFKANAPIPYNTTIAFNLGATINFNDNGAATTGTITDYTNVTACNETATATTITLKSYLEDKENPTIEYVEAIDSTTLKVVFSEDLQTFGQYKVFDGTTQMTGNIAATQWSSTVKNAAKVRIPANTLTMGNVYTLKVVSAPTDIANNLYKVTSDSIYDFVASSIVLQNYIKGVNIVDGKTIKVLTTKAYTAGVDVVQVLSGTTNLVDTAKAQANADGVVTAATDNDIIGGILGWGTKEMTVYLTTALKDGVSYDIDINGTETLTIKGSVAEGGVAVTKVVNVAPAADNYLVTFSDWSNTAQDYVVKVVYGNYTATQAVRGASGYEINTLIDTEVAVGATYTVEVYRAEEGVNGAVLYTVDVVKQ